MKALLWLAAGVGAVGLLADGARADVPFVGETFEVPVCVIVQVYYDRDGNPIDPFEHPDVRTDDVRATALASALRRYGSLFGGAPMLPDGVVARDTQFGSATPVAPRAAPAPGAGLALGAGAMMLTRRRRPC